ncbi:hydroxymethylpyrimidine/phosphomethylpyrimidine kinase [Alkalimarinus coralli]|uniref:hydroxymethylpyrimidine/phosphomethylpyrimidine kinase n=1 Tax=Alkalimarinus coralli TaxID=2935863 RepID=UPI00202B065A|nr:hydroxymethylpyrimidine/phosphomethylpyrimidine kinase [Alkalimarinus coralli]
MNQTLPVVLAIAGLDPSGGAGIQADIQTLSALNCHCTPVVSTLTVQDSGKLYQSQPVSPETLEKQLLALAADFHFSAIKLGALGNAENATLIAHFIQNLIKTTPSIPITLDPVIRASGGKELSDRSLQAVLLNKIIPHCTLVTPNEPELKALTGCETPKQAAHQLTASGTSVLLTGGHSRNTTEQTLENQLFSRADQVIRQKSWTLKLVDGEFRGTGCTFSSAIAAYMAQGCKLETAIEKSQAFVSFAVKNAYALKSGQMIPQRLATPTLAPAPAQTST